MADPTQMRLFCAREPTADVPHRGPHKGPWYQEGVTRGGRLSVRAASGIIATIAENACLDDETTAHILRHTFATTLVLRPSQSTGLSSHTPPRITVRPVNSATPFHTCIRSGVSWM